MERRQTKDRQSEKNIKTERRSEERESEFSPCGAVVQRMGHENELPATPNKSKSASQRLTRFTKNSPNCANETNKHTQPAHGSMHVGCINVRTCI